MYGQHYTTATLVAQGIKGQCLFLMVAKDESVPYRKVSTFLQGKKLIFVCVYECIITCVELIYAWDPIYVSVKLKL